MALHGQVDHRVQQRMARAQEHRRRLARRGQQPLLEGDALVARHHRLARADQPVAAAHRARHVGDLVAPRLPLPEGAAQARERRVEERLDVVRLQPPRRRPLHLLPHPLHARGVHGIRRQRLILQQLLQLLAVEGGIQHRGQPCPHLRLLPVADRLQQQVAQRPAGELQLAEHVEHLPAERLARLLQLLQQPAVDVALARLLRHQVPQVAHLGLADPVDAAEALLQAVRVPRQVVVHHQVGALQVDPLACRVGGQAGSARRDRDGTPPAPCCAPRGPGRRGSPRSPARARAPCRCARADTPACRDAR